MKKLFILFFLLTIGLFYSFDLSKNEFLVQKKPIIEVQFRFNDDLNKLIRLVKTANINLSVDSSSLVSDYQEIRNQFKKIEFLLAYIDIQHFNQYINGAPLPKLEKHVPNINVLEPKGLQVLQELIFSEQLNLSEIQNQYLLLSENIEKYQSSFYVNELTDPVFFECLHFGLIRLYALGVTGFDSPASTEETINESEISFNAMLSYFNEYKEYVVDASKDKLNILSSKSNVYFKNSFDRFDRLEFLRKIIDPCLRELGTVQKQLFIEMPYQRAPGIPFAVNYNANSIFSDDFYNIDFFSENYGKSEHGLRVSLGKKLFYDPILSSDNLSSCASCHKPELAFTDGLSKSKSNQIDVTLQRNAPTLLNAVYATQFFYDLRTDRLSSQMDHVVLNPDEFNTTYKAIATKLSNSVTYSEMFKDAFGNGEINRERITNVISAYVSSLRSYNSEFDQFVRGESATISDDVKSGYNLFTGKAACATCHFVPSFSGLVPPDYMENESEVLGVPNRYDKPYEIDDDLGRFSNRILKEQVDFFKYSFKTPTIRNVEFTAPFMHNGAFRNLHEVMEFYNLGGGAGLDITLDNQTLAPTPLDLSEEEIDQIIAFMNSLSDRNHMEY